MARKRGSWAAIAVSTALMTALIAPMAAKADATSPFCSAPDALMRFDGAMARTAARLAEGRSLRIVAFGSSSTAGAGATSPANSYPSRLEAELRSRFPDADVVVLNRGVGGEDAREMLARLDKSVIAEHPDLVLWQVGSNAIVDDEKLSDEASLVRSGLGRLKAAGIDVVLVDPQFVPKIIRKPRALAMVRVLEAVARDQQIGVFHRFAIMSHWRLAQRLPFAQFTAPDGLHMNDWSYDCIAKLMASALVEATNRPVPVATQRVAYAARS